MKKKDLRRKLIFGAAGLAVLFVLALIVNFIVFQKNASVVSTGNPIEFTNDVNPALLVVDIQESTTGEASSNKFYIENSELIINNINAIAKNFHDKKISVIYIRSEITNPLINLLNNSFAKGSLGAKFDKRLNILSDLEIVKSRNDAFYNTNLDKVLISNKINELYIVGLDLAHCINFTTEAAQNREYKICLIKEAVLSESVQMRDSMFIEYENKGVKLLSVDSLFDKQ